MKNLFVKRIVSLLLICVLIINTVVFADTVVVSNLPSNNVNNGSATTTSKVLSNVDGASIYSGPAAIPSDGVIVSMTGSDQNQRSVSYQAPVTSTIKSPASHMENTRNTTTSAVINNFNLQSYNDGKVTYKNPESYDLSSPGAEHSYTSSGPTSTSTTETDTYITVNTSTQHNDMANAYLNSLTTTYTANTAITTAKPNISAPAGIVVNATTKQIYYAKDPYAIHAPASLVNIMTSYLLINSKQLTDVLAVSYRAVNNLEDGASIAGLKAGDTITVADALAAMSVKSCCDVANVVAENVAGSIENFVTLMNQTAKSFGCVATNFTNPSGLNSDTQVTSVYDMAIIMDKATDNPSLVHYMGLNNHTMPQTAHRSKLTLHSKNTLLLKGSSHYYQGVTASRMGYTSKALYTLVSAMPYNNQKIITVVLHANGSQFSDTKKLLDFSKKAADEAMTNSSYLLTGTQLTTAQNTINSTQNVANVSTSGAWQQDSTGKWTFIKSNGTKAVNEWVEYNGKSYCVDASGYMITGWREFTNGHTYYFDPSTGELRYNTWVNTATGAYYLQADGSLDKATPGTTKNITTAVGVYTIDENGKAIAKVS